MGLLNGLQSMLGPGGGGNGGFLSGIHDYLSGTTPVMAPGGPAQNMGTMLPTNGPGTGGDQVQYTPPPTLTGNTTGGLLSKLQAPDARGLTFGDKLFAAGNVLQGDSGGAASYIQNQRANAQNEDDRMTARRSQLAGAKAFRNNMNPDGSMNFQGYTNDLGDELNPEKAVALRKDMRPDITPMSGANGALYGFNKDTGTFGLGVPGVTPQTLFNPDGSINQGFIEGKRQEALAVSKAQREGKPLAPRVGRAGPKRGSYGQNEIDWGG